MYVLIAVVAGILGLIAHDKKWNRLKVLCYFVALIALVLKAIEVWVTNFGSLM